MLAFSGVLALAGALVAAVVAVRDGGERRFLGSAAEIEVYARGVAEGDRLGPRSVGGMEFEEIRRERGVVVFQQGEREHSPYGYAWSPHGDPARLLADVEWSADHLDHRFEHLQGAFYSWRGSR
ncbi:hypothetical protein [Nonomuraea gerenzanensis]|uniref:hypothetical protein n=1 Tax=Nonomuraea gerenzanensis TaxID=93944 RepID=UPI001CDA249A|nr:hypothetical protein [Nonomuraea gerenzanensis]UBU09229.1 hypothetical protein LCN96_33230 [Nonomuraea gerenzanensis]